MSSACAHQDTSAAVCAALGDTAAPNIAASPILGNAATGAIVGGAIASQNGYYYGPGYYAPGYGGPAYVVDPGYGESCIWQRMAL